jgi:hypothetical protein
LITGVALVNAARAQEKAGKLSGPDIDIRNKKKNL